MNVLQRGSYVPQDELQDVWGAIIYIQAVKSGTAASVARYGLKEARTVTGYVFKNVGPGEPSPLDHFEANGGRLAHVSRGYFRENPDMGRPYTQV